MKVNITSDDIEKGSTHAGEYNKCPVAKALQRLGCQNIDADEDRILVTVKGQRYVYKTPRNVMLFIDDFDKGRNQEVKPISFVLEKAKLAAVDDERKPLC